MNPLAKLAVRDRESRAAVRPTITTYDPPNEIVFHVVGKVLPIVGRFRFADLGSETALRANFDMTPSGHMKVLLPLISPMARRDFPKQLNSFKAFCESR